MNQNECELHNVGVWKLHKDAVIPFQGTEMSACYDIYACLHTETLKVHGRNMGVPVQDFESPNAYFQMFPNEMVLVPTGLIFIIPPTHHLKFYSRSGNVWKRRLKVANQPAIIDADYTLESFVLLENTSGDPVIVRHGEAIAQAELLRNTKIDFKEIPNKQMFDKCIDIIKGYSSRDGGLGSTDGVGGVVSEK